MSNEDKKPEKQDKCTTCGCARAKLIGERKALASGEREESYQEGYEDGAKKEGFHAGWKQGLLEGLNQRWDILPEEE